MKKSIIVTSKTDWTKIKEIFGNFSWLKSQLEMEGEQEREELLEYVDTFSDNLISFKDIDLPLSKIIGNRFSDITLKETTIKAESDSPSDFKWVCNNLGSLKVAYNLSENNIKITIDFKPKFGFAANTFLKGLFMVYPLEELESGVQELIDDFDDHQMEEEDD